MHFETGHTYHVYNRGNNKNPLFFNDENYLYFLRKVRSEWVEFCDIICYCLMPNHFHFMLQPKDDGCIPIILQEKTTHLQKLSKTIGKTLSSYTQAINKQNKTTGNLFQKKTKAKCLTDETIKMSGYLAHDYLTTCFHYIHNNPLEDAMVDNLKDWQYSSWPDYYGFRNGTLCNKNFTMELLSLTSLDFLTAKPLILDKKMIEAVF